MGLAIARERFSAEEYALFSERLGECLEALRALLARPDFGRGEPSIGAELEMHLVDSEGAPLPENGAVLARVADPRVTLEINRFNLEINTRPVALAGRPFQALHGELTESLAQLRAAARDQRGRIALVGILPTLRVAHLADGVLSDAARYRALSRILRELRGEPFAVHIEGRESLRAHCDDVALEGANASFQVHLRSPPSAFAQRFNAAQLAAAPVLAASANSPFFDARSLWDETRIALFQQSVDTRVDARERARLPSRVPFGRAWIRDAYEPFAANVTLHPPLLPVLSAQEPRLALERGELPRLEELRLHHGTVWSWNRAVFDPDGGGHLRIEHRVLPSGPTVTDMLANAALTLGLTLGLAPIMDRCARSFPFAHAERNLYRSAELGLDAELSWPDPDTCEPRPRRARELVLSLLPLAEQALLAANVDAPDVRELFACLRERVLSGRTGARLQRAMVAQGELALGRERALRDMLESYLELSERDLPVHRWPIAL